MAHPGDFDIVTFENRTDQVVSFITESPDDSTPSLRFTLQPRGVYTERVPGADALTYEQLRLVEGKDLTGTKTNVTVTTDELRHLGGFKLTVTKTDNRFNELGREDIRDKSWAHQFTRMFSGLRPRNARIPR